MVSPTQGQVAHALLTRPPLGIAAPFDLNVLCTPPAFILSQDQTLEQIVYQPFPVNIKCVELVALFYFLSMHPVSSGCVSKNDEIFALASFLLVLKSPVVQLSMINRGFDSVLAFPLPVSPRLSRGQLIYYITFASTCQEVFKTFFKKFFACRSGGVCSFPSARLADYITFPAACQGGGEDFFRGGLTEWLPVCLAFSLLCCPHPPDPPSRREGGDHKLVLPGASPPAPLRLCLRGAGGG